MKLLGGGSRSFSFPRRQIKSVYKIPNFIDIPFQKNYVSKMQTLVVQVGNARGIQIPQNILSQCGILDAVNIEVENNQIIISPFSSAPREGWGQKFQEMREAGDDQFILPENVESEMADWTW